jgi:hypothetical protein
MTSAPFSVFTTWPFVLALVALIVNDAWLKSAWPGLVTGKLSDFAGIVVVGLLGLSCIPRRPVQICAAIAVFFAWWKGPWSQPFIDAVNSVSPMTIGRTVDYTDLLALLILPMCVEVARREADFAIPGAAARRLLVIPIGAATALALMATSYNPPRHAYVIRTIETTGELHRAKVVEEIDRVAEGQGLKCRDCADPLNHATYEGKGVNLAYTFTDARTVSFWVTAEEHGMLGGGGWEKLDRMRTQLKRQLSGTQVGLEFVEPLGPPQSPP